MRAGAFVRLYNTMRNDFLVIMCTVMSEEDEKRMVQALKTIEEIISHAEDNMYHDHPDLPEAFDDVFSGRMKDEPRSFIDIGMNEMAERWAHAIFFGERH